MSTSDVSAERILADIKSPDDELVDEPVEYNRDDFFPSARNAIRNSDMVVLTDGDADGIASAALIDDAFEGLSVGIIPIGPHEKALYPNQSLNLLLEEGRDDMTVFILDVCLNEDANWKVEPLIEVSERFRVLLFDHHEWTNEERVSFVDEHTSHLELDGQESTSWTYDGTEYTERCTVRMIYDYLVENGVQFDDELENRVNAVTAGDLWMKDEDKNFIHPQTQLYLDSIEYITDIGMPHRHMEPWFGYEEWAEAFCDTTTSIVETDIAGYAFEYREMINERVNILFDTDELLTQYTRDGLDIAFVYGDIPPNEVSEELREKGIDVVIVLFPWGKCSFRGTDNFAQCHQIASDLGGGGHGKAAGAPLDDINPYNSDKEYNKNNGEKVHEILLDKISEYHTETA